MPHPSSKSQIPGPGGDAMPLPHVVERDNRLGIIWILVSIIGASIMTLAVRQLSLEFDSRLIVMFRSVLSMLILIPLLILFTPLRRQLRFSRPMLHIARGVCVAVSTHLGFYTIAHIPLATATVLFFTAPVFATIMGLIFHGESIGPRRITAIVIGFIGALVILRPGLEPVQFGMFTALGSSFLFASALSMSRGLAQADGPLSTFFSSTAATALLSIPLSIPIWQTPNNLGTWLIVGALIITGSLRNIADIQAYRHAEAAVLAPITYLRLVFIGSGGYLLFGEIPDQQTLIGAAIIVSATLYVARRETMLKRRRAGKK